MVFSINRFFILLVCISPISNRKYDIESECLKTYGQPLSNVLHMFRRSPEYWKILKLKKDEVLEEFYDMYFLASKNFDKRREERIKTLLNNMKTNNPGNTTLAYARRHRNKVPGNQKPEAEGIAVSNISPMIFRRNNKNKSKIEMLDWYSQSVLSVDEKKMFASVGFEMAGELIHYVINGLNRDDLHDIEASTHLDGVDADFIGTTTTEHPKRHTYIPDPYETTVRTIPTTKTTAATKKTTKATKATKKTTKATKTTKKTSGRPKRNSTKAYYFV